jgi:hypothetical protein
MHPTLEQWWNLWKKRLLIVFFSSPRPQCMRLGGWHAWCVRLLSSVSQYVCRATMLVGGMQEQTVFQITLPYYSMILRRRKQTNRTTRSHSAAIALSRTQEGATSLRCAFDTFYILHKSFNLLSMHQVCPCMFKCGCHHRNSSTWPMDHYAGYPSFIGLFFCTPAPCSIACIVAMCSILYF